MVWLGPLGMILFGLTLGLFGHLFDALVEWGANALLGGIGRLRKIGAKQGSLARAAPEDPPDAIASILHAKMFVAFVTLHGTLATAAAFAYAASEYFNGEQWGFGTCYYFAFATFSTIGFGDFAMGPTDDSTAQLLVLHLQAIVILVGLAAFNAFASIGADWVRAVADDVAALTPRFRRHLGSYKMGMPRRVAPEPSQRQCACVAPPEAAPWPQLAQALTITTTTTAITCPGLQPGLQPETAITTVTTVNVLNAAAVAADGHMQPLPIQPAGRGSSSQVLGLKVSPGSTAPPHAHWAGCLALAEQLDSAKADVLEEVSLNGSAPQAVVTLQTSMRRKLANQAVAAEREARQQQQAARTLQAYRCKRQARKRVIPFQELKAARSLQRAWRNQQGLRQTASLRDKQALSRHHIAVASPPSPSPSQPLPSLPPTPWPSLPVSPPPEDHHVEQAQQVGPRRSRSAWKSAKRSCGEPPSEQPTKVASRLAQLRNAPPCTMPGLPTSACYVPIGSTRARHLTLQLLRALLGMHIIMLFGGALLFAAESQHEINIACADRAEENRRRDSMRLLPLVDSVCAFHFT